MTWDEAKNQLKDVKLPIGKDGSFDTQNIVKRSMQESESDMSPTLKKSVLDTESITPPTKKNATLDESKTQEPKVLQETPSKEPGTLPMLKATVQPSIGLDNSENHTVDSLSFFETLAMRELDSTTSLTDTAELLIDRMKQLKGLEKEFTPLTNHHNTMDVCKMADSIRELLKAKTESLKNANRIARGKT